MSATHILKVSGIKGNVVVKNARKILLIVIAVVAVFVAGWWAGNSTFGSRTGGDSDAREVTRAEAKTGSVGREYNFGVSVNIPTVPVATNALSGVVTRVGLADVDQGSLLYEVGDRGVFAVAASEPFYRDLTVGVKGEDVRALQEMLVSRGYDAVADGNFGTGTQAALKKFQADAGVASTGVAEVGTLVAFTHLPSVATYSPDLRAGKTLAGGEELVSAPVGERKFTISVGESQLEFVPMGARVVFASGGEEFTAVVASIDPSGDGMYQAVLSGVDGGAICVDNCDKLPSGPTASVMGRVIPEEPIEGVVLPAAAVVTLSDGSTVVLMEDNTERDVVIRGSGQGLVVVDGVEAGEKVVLGVEVAGG